MDACGAARPLAGTGRDYDPLLKLVGTARFCLLGEATHGTDEFYAERAEITKRLGFGTSDPQQPVPMSDIDLPPPRLRVPGRLEQI